MEKKIRIDSLSNKEKKKWISKQKRKEHQNDSRKVIDDITLKKLLDVYDEVYDNILDCLDKEMLKKVGNRLLKSIEKDMEEEKKITSYTDDVMTVKKVKTTLVVQLVTHIKDMMEYTTFSEIFK